MDAPDRRGNRDAPERRLRLSLLRQRPTVNRRRYPDLKHWTADTETDTNGVKFGKIPQNRYCLIAR